jgi:hypothetical protein
MQIGDQQCRSAGPLELPSSALYYERHQPFTHTGRFFINPHHPVYPILSLEFEVDSISTSVFIRGRSEDQVNGIWFHVG